MTRINLIDPSELCDKHLMAEYRELIRIPNAVYSGKMKTWYKDAPSIYTLGTGHVKFFVDKILWLLNRHQDLFDELRYRGFNVTEMQIDSQMAMFFKKNKLFNEYQPTKEEVNLNISRILDRMPENPKFTHREAPTYYEGNYR